MRHVLKRKLLRVPLIIWTLQLLYVAAALALLVVITSSLTNHASHLSLQIIYVLAMLAVNIAWRLVIRRKKPGWYADA